jgi:hypothetical protein
MKKIFFYIIMVFLPIAISIGLLGTFYGYRKLTLSYSYCGSYGVIDNTIGWTLLPNATSCLSLKNTLTGEVFFDSTIYTNNLGFRDVAANKVVRTGSIAFIGDSWTFGYGVNFEQSFPHVLSKELSIPIINMGVPAYGAGSTYQLFLRHYQELKPTTVVYFTLGLWTRSICHASMVDQTLLPCYFIDKNGEAQFALPPPGLITSMAKNNVYPGGYLTSGYTFAQKLFLKPYEIYQTLKVYTSEVAKKLGFIIFQNELDLNPSIENIDKILTFELNQYKNLLINTDVNFVLFDPPGRYANLIAPIQDSLKGRFTYLGKDYWDTEVASKFIGLSEDQIRIKNDGHFAATANSIIANSIAKALQKKHM